MITGNMETGTALAYAGLAWLIISVVSLAWCTRGTRALAETLAKHYPELYERLGRPRPGGMESLRPNRFATFIGKREYEQLDNKSLVGRFDAHRRLEARVVVSILGSGALLALLVLVLLDMF